MTASSAAPTVKRDHPGYQRRFGPRVFVETGTFAGGMIDGQGPLHADLLDRARPGWHAGRWSGSARSARDAPPRTAAQEVLDSLAGPRCWLDAHYSGPVTARGAIDSPIVREMEAIRAHPVAGHVVLIDDMRDFQGRDGYPTVDELTTWIRTVDPRGVVEVRDDILRWHPRASQAA
jgi:hypothetical protein